MIHSLKGILTEKGTGKFYLDCGGLEWEIETSFTSLSALPGTGSPARIFTHLYHREDSMRIYGFVSEEERSLFLDLLKVNGIGPRQALRILSGTTVESFARTLDAGDAASFARIPGLGLKTAQKLILALKGKLSFREEAEEPENNDLVRALEDMGFDRKKAAAVIQSLSAELTGEGLCGPELEKECFRRAIIRMSGS
jgi:Holliday junction DNA helicase RuvA